MHPFSLWIVLSQPKMYPPGFKHGVCSFGAVWQPDRCTAQGAQDSQIIFLDHQISQMHHGDPFIGWCLTSILVATYWAYCRSHEAKEMSDGSLALKCEDGGCLMLALRERVDLQNFWPQEGIPKWVSLFFLHHPRWMLCQVATRSICVGGEPFGFWIDHKEIEI